MRQVRGMGLVVALLALISLAGCSTLGGPRPTPETPADNPAVIAVDSAGDVGLLCLVISLKGSPEDVRKATLAVAAARAVLREPVPTYSKLSTALEEGMPPEYANISTMLLQRVRKRLGHADVLPVDTTGWAMAEEFLAICGQSLGSTASTDLLLICGGLEQLSGFAG